MSILVFLNTHDICGLDPVNPLRRLPDFFSHFEISVSCGPPNAVSQAFPRLFPSTGTFQTNLSQRAQSREVTHHLTKTNFRKIKSFEQIMVRTDRGGPISKLGGYGGV